MNVISQAIQESNGVIHGISGMFISNELVDKFRESIDIISDCCGLADVLKLTDQGFLLVPTKTLKQHRRKFRPRTLFKTFGHRLGPTRGCTIELIQSKANPKTGINRVHLKIILTSGDPEAGVVAIESVEV